MAAPLIIDTGGALILDFVVGVSSSFSFGVLVFSGV
jgi:hypothetical protein